VSFISIFFVCADLFNCVLYVPLQLDDAATAAQLAPLPSFLYVVDGVDNKLCRDSSAS
jgi:hypothetical protein